MKVYKALCRCRKKSGGVGEWSPKELTIISTSAAGPVTSAMPATRERSFMHA